MTGRAVKTLRAKKRTKAGRRRKTKNRIKGTTPSFASVFMSRPAAQPAKSTRS